jgi:hypothetical protein
MHMNTKATGPVPLVGGIILVILGFWLWSRSSSFSGDWPEVLSVGCIIWGAGSIFYGLKAISRK